MVILKKGCHSIDNTFGIVTVITIKEMYCYIKLVDMFGNFVERYHHNIETKFGIVTVFTIKEMYCYIKLLYIW